MRYKHLIRHSDHIYRIEAFAAIKAGIVLMTLLGLALLISGCSETETNAKSFSDAATICTGMTQQIATAEQAEDVKANSDKLIASRQNALHPPLDSAGHPLMLLANNALQTLLSDELGQDDKTMAKRLVLLGQIRDQSQLLTDYFKALSTLAGTDVTTPSTNSAKTLASSLSDLNQSVLSNIPNAKANLPTGGLPAFPTDAVPLLAVGYQTALLKRELHEDGPVIQKALRIQTLEVTFMVANFYRSMKNDNSSTYPTSVTDTYTGDGVNKPGDLPSTWADARAKGLAVEADGNELSYAVVASQELERAFANLRAGKYDPTSVARMTEYNTTVTAILNKYASSTGK